MFQIDFVTFVSLIKKENLKAEIITIGDEILIGQIVDTNSQWIAIELNKIGISVYQVTSIQDDEVHILEALKNAKKNADLVLITGGLGPTKDDITKHTLANFFKDTLVLNENIVNHIKTMFSKRNISFSELNRLQGMVPTKCIPLHNNYGTAPGMWFEEDKTIFVSMPGVPFEMKGLMKEEVLPRLQSQFTLPFIKHKTLITYGMGESAVAEKLDTWENKLPSNISLAYLPAPGRLKLRLSGKGIDKKIVERQIREQTKQLENILGELVVGHEDDEDIVKVVARLLLEFNKTLAIAESCTGGALSQLLTANSGASSYFLGSVISYSEKIKINTLEVSQELIKKHSVVSKEVAEAMAVNIQKKFQSDYSIATTGNTGPGTDNTQEEVGVVYIAIATPTGVYSSKYNFGTPREKVIQKSSNEALNLLRKEIQKNYRK